MKTINSITFIIGFFFAVLTVANANHSHIGHIDLPSTHGMVIVGTDTIYLSHLPMFHSPHDYQVILEVEMNPQAKEIYLQSKLNNPQERVFTLVPETFILPDMIENPRPFTAQIFAGHFERGGQPITDTITINISKVIYFKKFPPHSSHPEVVKYIYFGNEKEIFAAHIIQAKPDFDHLVEVETSPMLIDLLKFETYLEVELPHLKKQKPLAIGPVPLSYVLVKQKRVPLDAYEIEGEVYLEYNDLSF